MAKKSKKKKTKKRAAAASGSKTEANSSTPLKTEPPHVIPFPQAGRKVIEFEERLDAALSGDYEAPKRGRGRPRKEAEPEPVEIDIHVIAQAVQVPFDLWALSQGIEQLKISEAEAILIGKPLKELLDYYLPQIPPIAWAWVSFTAATYGVIKARLIIIAEVKKQRQDRVGDGTHKSSTSQSSSSKTRPSDSFPSYDEITKGSAQ